MSRGLLIIISLLFLVIITGCVTQTGRFAEAGPNLSDINFDESYEEAHQTNVIETIPAENASKDSPKIIVTKEIIEEEPCTMECGDCKRLDKEVCSCTEMINCCGNGVCEVEETLDSCTIDCPDLIMFTEVLYDAKKPENDKEWFEIYNPTDLVFDLTGYSVSDNDYRWEFPEGAKLESKNYLVVARDSDGFYEEYGCQPDVSGFSRTMNNDGDILIMKDRGGNTIDIVSWKNHLEGWGLFAEEGRTIKRENFNNTDSPSDWLNNKTATPANCGQIYCKDSEKTCEDGYISVCCNSVINDDCTDCEPDCTGHEITECEETWVCSEWNDCTEGMEERECTDLNSCGSENNKPNESRECFSCDIECGICKYLNVSGCVCIEMTDCDGNGICEEGEYGNSSDCPDCDDDNNCTEDGYNHNEGGCYNDHIIPCCGNGVCEEGENSTSCIEDCENKVGDTNISLHVMFTEVGYDVPTPESKKEWMEICNPTDETVNLTGWKISDNNCIWSFPDGSFIGQGSHIIIAKNASGFAEMFNCSPDMDGFGGQGLNDEGDYLLLNNSLGELIDFVSWENYTDGWDIFANKNKTIKRISNGDGPDNWLSEQDPDPFGC